MQNDISRTVPDGQSLDRTYELLSDRRRRRVVDYLADRDSRIALDALAAAVAARESSGDAAAERSAATHDVAATLHHVHLPKLAAADLVDYDPHAMTVRPDGIEALATFVDTGDR